MINFENYYVILRTAYLQDDSKYDLSNNSAIDWKEKKGNLIGTVSDISIRIRIYNFEGIKQAMKEGLIDKHHKAFRIHNIKGKKRSSGYNNSFHCIGFKLGFIVSDRELMLSERYSIKNRLIYK